MKKKNNIFIGNIMTLPCLTYALKEKPLECQVSFLSPTEKEKPIQEKNKKTSTSAFVIFCIFIIVFFVALLVLKYFLFAEMKVSTFCFN